MSYLSGFCRQAGCEGMLLEKPDGNIVCSECSYTAVAPPDPGCPKCGDQRGTKAVYMPEWASANICGDPVTGHDDWTGGEHIHDVCACGYFTSRPCADAKPAEVEVAPV